MSVIDNQELLAVCKILQAKIENPFEQLQFALLIISEIDDLRRQHEDNH